MSLLAKRSADSGFFTENLDWAQISAERSAQGCALMRYVESQKTPAVRLFEDPFARLFLSDEHLKEYRSPSAHVCNENSWLFWLGALRERYIDDLIHGTVPEDTRQLVVLGSGYDSRSVRMKEFRRREVKIFEVDRQMIITRKKRVLLRQLHYIPSNLRFVVMDFHRDNFDTLIRSGLNPKAGTLFVAQALSYYLSVPAMERIFNFIIGEMQGSRKLIFDYVDSMTMASLCSSDWFTLAEMRPFCLEPKIITDYLSNVGFKDVFDASISDIEECLTDQNTLPPFGWHIVSCSAP